MPGGEGELTSKLVYRCTICHAVYSAGERFCPLDAGPISPEGDVDPRIGKTIDGRYFIRRLIGRGGMGAVYEADHVGLDKRVAIKFLAINKTDRDALLRFRREAKIASKIHHEHVVQIFDVGTADADTDFIVMEFLEGKDLAGHLKDTGAMTPERAVSIARKVLRGLRAIHQAGIVHRDIKPANILLSPREEDRDFVKIMDFGISRQVHGDTITSTGAIIGTPEYMAPEQLLADDIDQRADIYAVGVMMYRMVAGRLPFTDDKSFDRAAAANPYVEVPRLDSVRPGIASALGDVIAKAVAKNRDNRYPDAQAFLTALEALGSMSLAAKPAQAITGTEQTLSQDALADTAIAPSEVKRTSGLAPSGITVPAKRTDPRVPVHGPAVTAQPERVTTPPPASRTGIYIMLGLLVAGAAIAIAIVMKRGDGETTIVQQPPAPPTNTAAGGPTNTSPSSGDKAKGLLAKARTAEGEGKHEDALKAYQEAYAADPADGTIFKLAQLHERLGHTQDAIRFYQEYLHVAKDPPDKAMVTDKIAKLEKWMADELKKLSANGQTGRPATAPAVATSSATGPLEDCHCLPIRNDKQKPPDSMSLCEKKDESLCTCRLQPNNYDLCTVAMSQCAEGDPGCKDGWLCSASNYDKPHIKGVHDAPCRGWDFFDGQNKEGKLNCSVCSKAKGPRLFRGHHDQVCFGYHRNTGARYEGRLWCKYP